MNEIAKFNNSKEMSSLEIAEITGKRHADVLRDIRNLIEQGANERNFALVEYKDKKGEIRPCYNLTPKGCLILASGYDVVLREKIINRLEELEMQKKKNGGFSIPQTMSEALRLAADQQEEIEQQKLLINEQAPKVAFANAIEASKSSCLVGELAKILTQNGYTIGQNRLFEWLRNNGYLGTKGEYYNIPNQTYIEQGLFDLKKGIRSGNDGVMHTTMTTKVTGKGQRYFINKFLGGR